MKKKKTEKVLDNPMKSALDDLNVRVSSPSTRRRFSLREMIWNYPTTLYTLYKKLIPISYIFLFSLLAGLLILIFNSSSFAKLNTRSVKKDTFVEGLVGSVNSLNPLFVTNNFSDRAIQSLVFEKFVNIDKDGNPTPGVAKSWVSSGNGLVIDFKIDKTLKWSDGSDLSIEDVLFTFESAVKLAKRSDTDSVGEAFESVGIEKIDEETVRFTLKENNPVFFKAVSIYIVPKARLEGVDIGKMAFDQFSKYPMGSGKFRVEKIDDYEVVLEDNKYDRYDTKIKKIIFKIYPTLEAEQMAFRVGELDAVGGWDKKSFEYTDEYSNFTKYSMTIRDRERLIFFNTRKESLKNDNMRRSLNYLFDKIEYLNVLDSGGEVMYGPLPSSSWAYNNDIEKYEYNPQKAEELLKDLGYTMNSESGYYESANKEILNFTITYLDTPTNNRMAELLAEFYKKEGVFLKIEKVEYNQITQEVVATRNFELLLYEVETTIDPDQYNLWHSLKVNYPDLNLSGYSYERVDILLEEGRQTTNKDVRKQKYALFQRYLNSGSPAIFLFNPAFTYTVNSNLRGVDLESVNNSYARFHNIEDWYWE